jgi:hypothetical protein
MPLDCRESNHGAGAALPNARLLGSVKIDYDAVVLIIQMFVIKNSKYQFLIYNQI